MTIGYVYGDGKSGNCYKIQLLASFLELDYEWRHIDILAGDTRQEDFVAKNPNAKIPMFELTDGRVLTESNAILNYLAHGSSFLPEQPFELAKVQQWQFFEQYSHEPFIAVARYINKYLGLPQERKAEYESKQAGGHKALAVMDKQLSVSRFLVSEKMTTADVSLYGYTHVAHEGGFDLSSYQHIQRWLKDIEAQPNYRAMEN